MKKFCVIFDTNVILEYKTTLHIIKSKIKPVGDIFIPRVVISEVQGQKTRDIRTDYQKISNLIKKNSDSFVYDESFELEDVISKSEDDIERWLEEYCDKNILDYNNIKLNDILFRAKYKVAPFIDEQGSSDKGFKDSLIWLSILKNKDIEKYDEVILVTNDKSGFNKRETALLEEYETQNKNKIVFKKNIEELYEELYVSKKDDINKSNTLSESEDVNIIDAQHIKEELNQCVHNILYNNYDDDQLGELNFNIYKKMNDNDIEAFLELLDDFLAENMFFYSIDISDLFNRCGIEASGENVEFVYLSKLNDIYKSVKNDKHLLKALVYFLKTEFNKLYIYKPQIEIATIGFNNDYDDLPF